MTRVGRVSEIMKANITKSYDYVIDLVQKEFGISRMRAQTFIYKAKLRNCHGTVKLRPSKNNPNPK